jgi:hypothetical protein
MSETVVVAVVGATTTLLEAIAGYIFNERRVTATVQPRAS